MCGISGFLERAQTRAVDDMTSVVRTMRDQLRHRGPDDAGAWCDPEAGIGLGQQRLSIIDLSPEGHQPMASGDGRYVIVFNGEIYNFQELRSELAQSTGANAVMWRGHSDTEVMLAAIVRWGVAGALQRFNGMFAFALWDRTERALYLARDRAGEKPLYYGWSGGALVFGSELRALRKFPDWKCEIDRGAIRLLFRHGYIPAPHTIYREVFKLRPGSFLVIRASELSQRKLALTQYWNAHDVAVQKAENSLQLSPQEALDRLDVLLRDSVRLRMVADVPLGAFLSGGIDSSLIVALMQSLSTRAVKTFSIGFPESQFNEAKHAAQVARHIGTDHSELYVTYQEMLAVVPRLPDLYDEPFADSSQIPTYLVAGLARSQVTVSLSGDGGDELFGGYQRYRRIENLWRTTRSCPSLLRGAIGKSVGRIARTLDVGPGLIAKGKVERWRVRAARRLADGGQALAISDRAAFYRRMTSAWATSATAVVGGDDLPTVFQAPDNGATLSHFQDQMMYLDLAQYLPDDILVKVDRATMAVGLESRIPLLDHRVIEFAWNLPYELKCVGGKTKWLLRHLLHRYVPRDLVERPKMGFGVPLTAWLRGPLRD